MKFRALLNSKMEPFRRKINSLIKPLTVFAKSSSLEVHSTGSVKFVSDRKSLFYKQNKKQNQLRHTSIRS